MESQVKPVPVADLRALVLQIMERCGVSAEDGQTTADVLVTTDTWGIFTHGTKPLYLYTRRLRAKGLKPRGRPHVLDEGPAWAVVDGDSSIGMVTGVYAMKLALAKSAASGVALVVVRNSCTIGAAGYYASLAAGQGQLGIAVCNAPPNVAAPGSRGPVLGSNPFAFGAASATGGAMVLDIATSEAAGGKIDAAAAEGRSVPNTWLVGAEGQPVTDPNLFLKSQAFLAPMAGHKGYGIGLMIEVLCALSGGMMRDRVRSFADPPGNPTHQCHAFLAINPGAFLGEGVFPARLDDLFQGIRAVPAVPGCHVKIPGEMEEGMRRKALAEGIVFPAEVLRLLKVAAVENGCPVPPFLA